jgi:hypothetical protein
MVILEKEVIFEYDPGLLQRCDFDPANNTNPSPLTWPFILKKYRIHVYMCILKKKMTLLKISYWVFERKKQREHPRLA